MRLVSNSNFQPHMRWIWYDVVSLIAAGGMMGWLAYINKSLSEDPPAFSVWPLIGFSSIYLAAYFITAFTYESERYFGLFFLLRVAAFGSLIYLCGSMVLILVVHDSDSLREIGFSLTAFLFFGLTLAVFLSMLFARVVGAFIGKVLDMSGRVSGME